VHNAVVRRFALFFLIFSLLLTTCQGRDDSGLQSAERPPARPKVRPPVVVIGIDGATWYVLRQLVRDGQAPSFARLMEKGAWGDLQTMAPTKSPAIWTTIATGYSPERHGIGDFTVAVPGTGDGTLVGSNQRREAALWNLATDANITVGVVNWWATFPAETVGGFLVSDRANLRRRFAYQSALGLNDPALKKIGAGETYPADLLPKILGLVGANTDLPPLAKTMLVDPMPPAMQEEVANHQTLVRDKRLSVLKFVLLQDHAASTATRVAIDSVGLPKLLMVYFSGLDAAEHQFWAYYEPHRYTVPPPSEDSKALGHVVPSYYRYVDALVGDLLKRVPSDSIVILVSDHGQDANYDWDPTAPIGEYGKWTMGSHGNAPPGILLISGPGVQAGYLRRVTVYDVTPTILALIGIGPSKDMPGRVVTEAFTPEGRAQLATNRVDRKFTSRPAGKPTKADVDPELLEKLRSLGYIQ
jgi:hypothetical protein